ncbi:MAG TPA: DUF1015 family protein [Fibrobacteria bacterium]|nr:DUF1015 family protein [Fibrobacteria bacterium]
MSHVRPLQGVRYDLSKVGCDPAALFCPPEDQLTPTWRRSLFHRSPWNFVRVCTGAEGPEQAPDARSAASVSRRIVEDWLRGGILVRDPRPSFYVYRQTFAATVGGVDDRFSRIGLVAILDGGAVVGNAADGAPSGAEASLRVHLHDEPSADIAGLLEAAKPVHLRFLDENSVEHSLQVLDDPETVRSLQGVLRNIRTVPLDGGFRPGSGPHLALLVAADDPGLVLRPDHRIYRHLDPAALESAEGMLRAASAVEELPYLGADAAEALLATLPENVHGFAFRRRDSDTILLFQVPFTGEKALDSTFLGDTFDRAVLPRPQDRERRMEHVSEGHGAMEKLDSDPEASLAILLRPVGTGTLFSLAGTDSDVPAIAPLHPRPWSGLVSHFPDA